MTEVLAMIGSILVMKLTAILVGYKIVRLGHDALVRGIKGEFDFGGKLSDRVEVRLLSASPGLFFVLFGSFVICWALFVQKPVSFEKETRPTPSADSRSQPEPEPAPEVGKDGK